MDFVPYIINSWWNIESNKVKDIHHNQRWKSTWPKKQLNSDPMPLELITPLVNSQLTSDGEKFEQWCFVRCVSRSPDRCEVDLGQ